MTLKERIQQAIKVSLMFGMPAAACCTIVSLLVIATYGVFEGENAKDESLIAATEACMEQYGHFNSTNGHHPICNDNVLEGQAFSEAFWSTAVFIAKFLLPPAAAASFLCFCMGVCAGYTKEHFFPSKESAYESISTYDGEGTEDPGSSFQQSI